jgi:hypothetical protein
VKKISVATLCRKAAKIIETRGWIKRSMGSKVGPVCMMGAIYEVISGVPAIPREMLNYIFIPNQVLMDQRTKLCGAIFNDNHFTTKVKVLRLLSNVSKSSKWSKVFVELTD